MSTSRKGKVMLRTDDKSDLEGRSGRLDACLGGSHVYASHIRLLALSRSYENCESEDEKPPWSQALELHSSSCSVGLR